jgi:hypothetical protein
MTRLFDLSVFSPPREPMPYQLLPALFDPAGSKVCTGALKLAQRYLVELMTPAGSIVDDPTRGTQFVPALRNGYIRTTTDLSVVFALSNASVARHLLATQTAEDPLDEQFLRAQLESSSVGGGQVALRILLETAAESSLVILLPVPAPPRG